MLHCAVDGTAGFLGRLVHGPHDALGFLSDHHAYRRRIITTVLKLLFICGQSVGCAELSLLISLQLDLIQKFDQSA